MAEAARLYQTLAGLRDAVRQARPPLTAERGDGEVDARRQRLVWHLDAYLLPRVLDLDAPLVAVLLGSTGAGKSSLLNGLAGRRVSPSGVTRPTTREPVLLAGPAEAGAVSGGWALGTLAREGGLEVVTDPSAPPGVALVDAPDLDSVETAHHLVADRLLHAADLCVFVTTAQRYADAAPWAFLYRARDRAIPLLVVVNRLPSDPEDRRAVLADCRRRLEEAGLGSGAAGGPLRLIEVLEGERDPATDGLRPAALAPLRAALEELAAGGPGHRTVRLRALRGALAGLPKQVGAVAADLDAGERHAAGLRAVVRRSYQAEQAALERGLSNGLFLRGEVMRAWQEFVGAGDVARWLAGGIGRMRAWVARRFRPPSEPVPLQSAKQHAFEELTAAVVSHADVAASRAAEEWSADPAAAELLADRADLWGHDPALPDRAERELGGWLGRLTELVRERGHNRKAVAFTASVGVNAVGVLAMLAVFAHSAGLTGGEVAIAGGTALVNQKLLEALFGEAAVRELVHTADADLRASLERLLSGDAERFLALLPPPEVTPSDLHAVAEQILTEADELEAPAGHHAGRLEPPDHPDHPDHPEGSGHAGGVEAADARMLPPAQEPLAEESSAQEPPASDPLQRGTGPGVHQDPGQGGHPDQGGHQDRGHDQARGAAHPGTRR